MVSILPNRSPTGAAPRHQAETTRRGWPPVARALVVSVLAIAAGSLFVTSYMLALGDPVPRQINVAVVGSATSRQDVVNAIEDVTDGSVTTHTYPSVAAALHAVDEQQVYAALDLTQGTPYLYVASAAGASVARVLDTVSAADPEIRVVDTHPLPASDPEGLDVFYLVIGATIIGFLTVFQVRANAGGISLRAWTAFVAVFALAGSLALTLVVGPILHRLALPLMESWGILALQMLTVAAFASTMAVLIGRWAIVPTFLFFMVLGNPSSGGAVSPAMLPEPLAVVSPWLPSGTTVSALRDAVYFHAYQHPRPVVVLAAWAATCLGAMLVISRRRRTSPGIT
jgi:hypothetical protein